jgi:hypothetical protein
MIRLSKEKRDKLILVSIGTVAVVAGLWFGVINTRHEQIGRTRTRLEKAIEQLENAKKVVNRAPQAQADMESASRKLSAIEDTMASGDPYSWALLLIEKARVDQDVKIIDVTRPGPGAVGVLAQFPYAAANFTVRGTAYYHDFGKFLAGFENRFPYFRVQNLSLTAGSEGTAGADNSGSRAVEEKLSFKMDIVALTRPNQ